MDSSAARERHTTGEMHFPLLVFTLSCLPRRPYARARARAGASTLHADASSTKETQKEKPPCIMQSGFGMALRFCAVGKPSPLDAQRLHAGDGAPNGDGATNGDGAPNGGAPFSL